VVPPYELWYTVSGWPHALQGRAGGARKRGEGPTRALQPKSAQQSTEYYTVLDIAEKLKMGFSAVTQKIIF
jgi:hypothetical protein